MTQRVLYKIEVEPEHGGEKELYLVEVFPERLPEGRDTQLAAWDQLREYLATNDKIVDTHKVEAMTELGVKTTSSVYRL